MPFAFCSDADADQLTSAQLNSLMVHALINAAVVLLQTKCIITLECDTCNSTAVVQLYQHALASRHAV